MRYLVRRWRGFCVMALGAAGVLAVVASPAVPQQPAASAPAKRANRKQAAAKPAPTKLPDSVEAIRDVEYGRVGNRALLLDIVRPKRPAGGVRMPAVVWIHGGGWRRGTRGGMQNVPLAERGYFTVSIEYRLSDEATFPAAIEDCKCAIRWLRANAEKYGVDADHIGVWGSSAGGHLSLLAATADEKAGLEGTGGSSAYSSRVQAVVSYCGPSDLALNANRPAAGREDSRRLFIGATYPEKPDAYRLGSPVSHASPDDPPALLIHGESDTTVPIAHAEHMEVALKKVGVPVTLIRVKNATHGFAPAGSEPIEPSREELTRRAIEFFDRHLRATAAGAGGS